MDKVLKNAADAVADIKDGVSIAVGGFGLVGIPSVLIQALLKQGAENLTVVSNNCGVDGVGLGLLLEARRIKRVIASYVGENHEFARQILAGELEVEKLRAGGAGIPAFYTPAGVGTLVSDGGLPYRYASDGSVTLASKLKEVRTFNGSEYVLEESITTDFALIHAHTVDRHGNCVFNLSARNFNPIAAMAGRITIVEAEHVVEAGEINPADIHLPGVYVQRVIALTPAEVADKRIEKLTVRA
jgi:3-oxoacid CoA-transferase subunit A